MDNDYLEFMQFQMFQRDGEVFKVSSDDKYAEKLTHEMLKGDDLEKFKAGDKKILIRAIDDFYGV